MGGLLGEMTVRLGVDISNFSSGISQASSLLTKFASTPLGALATGIAAVGAAAIGIGVAATQAANDFQTSTAKIQAYAGLTGQQVQDMSNKVLQMAADVGQSPKSITDAMYPLISSGYSVADSLNMVSLSAKTAAASGAQTTDVTKALVNVMGAFGFSGSQAANVMDVLNKSTSQGNFSMPELANSIGKVSLTAKSAGVSFIETNATLDVLTTHGFPSVAQAATAASNLFNAFGVKTDTMAKNAKSLGLTFDEQKFKTLDLAGKIQYLTDITGGSSAAQLKLLNGSKNALQAFQALSSNTKVLTADVQGMGKAQGTTAQIWATASQTFGVQSQKMQAALQALLISIGNGLLPVLTKIMSAITPIITSFANWITQSGVLQNATNVLANTFNFLYSILSPLVQWIYNLSVQFLNNQNVAIAFHNALIGIGQFLQSVFVPLWQQLVQVFYTQLLPAWVNLQNVIGPILPILQFVGELFGGFIVASIGLAVGAIAGIIGALGGFLGGVAIVFGGIAQFVSGFIQANSAAIQFFTDLFTGNFNKLGSDLQHILSGVLDMFRGLWNAVVGLTVAATNSIIGLVNGMLSGLLGALNTVLTATGHAAISVGQIPTLSAPSVGGFAMPGWTSQTTSSNTNNSQVPSSIQNFLNGLTSAANTKMPTINTPTNGAMPTIPNMPSTNIPTATTPGMQGTPQDLNQVLSTPMTQGANNIVNAVNSASSKSAAAKAKAQDAANARAARLQAEQQKALNASSSSAVQKLVDQSKSAAASGQTSMASFYAQQAVSLANQQKAATQRAARQAQAQQHHEQVLANQAQKKADAAAKHAQVLQAAADRKAQAAQNHQEKVAAAAAQHAARQAALQARQAQAQALHQQKLAAAAAKHAQKMNALNNIHSSLKNGVKVKPDTSNIPTSLTPVYSDSGTSGGATNSYITPAASTAPSGQPLTIIVDLDGSQIAEYIGDTLAKTVRLRTGRRTA